MKEQRYIIIRRAVRSADSMIKVLLLTMGQFLSSIFDQLFVIFSTNAERLMTFIDQVLLFVIALLYPFRKFIAMLVLVLIYSFLTVKEVRIYFLLVAFHLLCAAVVQRYYCTETEAGDDNDDEVEDRNTAEVDIRDARLKRLVLLDISGG